MVNYFVGVLLDASKNKDNKLEYTVKDGQCYYRVGGFTSKWDFNKAKKVPCKANVFVTLVNKAKEEMRARGLAVPGVFMRQEKLRKKRCK